MFYINRQEKANAGNVTQKIHPPLKQSTLIHTQTHVYMLFAFAYVADLSDGDTFYLHCSFCRGQMGCG